MFLGLLFINIIITPRFKNIDKNEFKKIKLNSDITLVLNTINQDVVLSRDGLRTHKIGCKKPLERAQLTLKMNEPINLDEIKSQLNISDFCCEGTRDEILYKLENYTITLQRQLLFSKSQIIISFFSNFKVKDVNVFYEDLFNEMSIYSLSYESLNPDDSNLTNEYSYYDTTRIHLNYDDKLLNELFPN